jgi:YD repeat-containing protein
LERRVASMRPFLGCRSLALAVALSTCLASGVDAADDLYEYDATGRLSQVTYHTGQVVSYSYDDRSNISAIVQSFLVVGVEPAPETPAFVNALRASRPNPARGEATLWFSLARAGRATIRLFGVSGRLVRTITDRDYPAGEYEARVMNGKWPAGVYFVRFETPGFSATRRLVVIK